MYVVEASTVSIFCILYVNKLVVIVQANGVHAFYGQSV